MSDMQFTDGDVIAINKPAGMTSHDVVAMLRRVSGIKRIGHAGTLDPLARGVLILLIGRSATKRQAELMGLPKEYEAELTFGSVSETGDAEGPLHAAATLEELATVTESAVRAVLPRFTGTILQTPPLYSALKRAGKPLYAYARQGTAVAEKLILEPRSVQIDEIKLLQFVPCTPPFPPTARLRIACHKGTYIRSLARDIGEALNVGAYLSDLVRTRVGTYMIADALTLESLTHEQ